MDRQIDRYKQIDRQIDKYLDKYMDRQIDRYMDRQIDRYIFRQIDRQIDNIYNSNLIQHVYLNNRAWMFDVLFKQGLRNGKIDDKSIEYCLLQP